MPILVVKIIGNMQIESYSKELQMEDKICRKPMGVVKDVLIKINKFSFLVDFIILDVKVDPKL